MNTFCTSPTFSVPAAGLPSRSQLRGTQGGRVYTRRTLWSRPGYVARGLGVPSKSLDLASNRGVVFRPAEPRKAMENPKMCSCFFTLCWCIYCKFHTSPPKAVFFDAATALQQPRFKLFPL